MRVDRLWTTGGYLWRNGEGALIRSAHRSVDAVTSRRAVWVKSRGGDGAPSLAYAGLPEGIHLTLPFLEQRRGAAAETVRISSRHRWDRLSAEMAGSDTDLVVTGYDTRRARQLPQARSLTLPFRVSLVVALGDGTDVLQRVSRKDRQQFARQQRSSRWTLEVADSDADFAYFYDRMHMPTMRARHGDSARSEGRATAHAEIYRKGALFFLRQSGERVVGALCRVQPAGRTLVLRLVGVADGDLAHYHGGTYTALFLYVLQWAARNGMARVDLGGCEPFISKGTFQFKRKLHPEVVLPANHFRHKRLHFTVVNDTEPVRRFLVENPVIALDAQNRLTAVYFNDSRRSGRTRLPWRTAGMASAVNLDLDTFLHPDAAATLLSRHDASAATTPACQ
ncbi:GNAT family N-acetyltransferase [Streptomyces sp. NPDC021093]|uniref:GNAT family N-acetyltransferase n=1 Tax=Streptomyces sp. NPDC021093 TaxID=3365112 RepID=UPI0037A6E993